MIKDIEDTIYDGTMDSFIKDFVERNPLTEKEYETEYASLRKKYKICPNKPRILKRYRELVKNKIVTENNIFSSLSLKKKGKSLSGVSVITILTSPTPEYINLDGVKIKQTFSCGHNCSYCPNEKEVKLLLIVKDINMAEKRIDVYTDDNIKQIRLLTYITYNNKNYNVSECTNFKDPFNSFSIILDTDIPPMIRIGENILGIKGEQPRSYLSTEPAVLRANRNHFDATMQIYDRADALTNCGHLVDKIEVLVLGGTWDNYPLEYQEEFIRDIYFATNTLETRITNKLSLKEEIKIAQRSKHRLIGITIETRPDYINLRQIRRLRDFNITRIQIGVQHIDEDVLNYNNRGCSIDNIIKGNHLWKNNGGKVDWHLMPDLPGSSIEKDMEMFRKIFSIKKISTYGNNYFKYELEYPELQADQLKIYPCSVVDWTDIKEWYENGKYKPYSENEEDLIKVIAYIKNNIFPWIRLNRIIRDIPNINIIGGNKNVNLRQTLLNRENINCKCIRCREVKDNIKDIKNAELFIREYNAINANEYFISFESPNKKILYGFLRLRINHKNEDLINESLYDTGLIRELHVYGKLINHKKRMENNVQHNGFGKRLLREAERITSNFGMSRIAVISGVGVREYYEKNGYHLDNNYMVKELINKDKYFENLLIMTIFLILLSIFHDIYIYLSLIILKFEM